MALLHCKKLRHSVRSGFQPVSWAIPFASLAVASPFERVRARSLRVMRSRRMGEAKRYPSMLRAKGAEDDGFRFALPILR